MTPNTRSRCLTSGRKACVSRVMSGPLPGATSEVNMAQPSGFWYGRGRMSGDGAWHTIKLLTLDSWEAETFCGSSVQAIRRALPAKARECPKCRSIRGAR